MAGASERQKHTAASKPLATRLPNGVWLVGLCNPLTWDKPKRKCWWRRGR